MRLGRALRHFLFAFALALGLYAGLFGWIQHRRAANGPWEVTFAAEADAPLLIVNQYRLGITNVRLHFPDHRVPTNLPQVVTFSTARPVPFDVPLGRCVFLDPLFLPGTVALEVFDHQVQLLPRVLTIDGQEHQWRSGETLSLPLTGGPSAPP
jgi:hypothetical protein